MPGMPEGDPWSSVFEVHQIEENLRTGNGVNIQQAPLADYWKDLARLLHAYRAWKDKDAKQLEELMNEMQSDIYKMFIQARVDALTLPRWNEKTAGEPQ